MIATMNGRIVTLQVCEEATYEFGTNPIYTRDVDTAELAALHEIVARRGSWPARMAVERIVAAAEDSFGEPMPVSIEDWHMHEQLRNEYLLEIQRMTK